MQLHFFDVNVVLLSAQWHFPLMVIRYCGLGFRGSLQHKALVALNFTAFLRVMSNVNCTIMDIQPGHKPETTS